LTESEATEENDQYQEAVKWLQTKSRDEGIDACLKRHSLDLMVAPWSGMLILPLLSVRILTASIVRASYISGIAGYPMLTRKLQMMSVSFSKG
jgi:hypothetical protein